VEVQLSSGKEFLAFENPYSADQRLGYSSLGSHPLLHRCQGGKYHYQHRASHQRQENEHQIGWIEWWKVDCNLWQGVQ
jgi:hypothetical protein